MLEFVVAMVLILRFCWALTVEGIGDSGHGTEMIRWTAVLAVSKAACCRHYLSSDLETGEPKLALKRLGCSVSLSEYRL